MLRTVFGWIIARAWLSLPVISRGWWVHRMDIHKGEGASHWCFLWLPHREHHWSLRSLSDGYQRHQRCRKLGLDTFLGLSPPSYTGGLSLVDISPQTMINDLSRGNNKRAWDLMDACGPGWTEMRGSEVGSKDQREVENSDSQNVPLFPALLHMRQHSREIICSR